MKARLTRSGSVWIEHESGEVMTDEDVLMFLTELPEGTELSCHIPEDGEALEEETDTAG